MTRKKKSNSKGKKEAVSSNEDRISDLHDDILQHILGFLPAQQAVQTCVLAQRWRHLWKSMRSLRITKQGSWGRAGDLNKFMNGLLLLRNPDIALDQVEFTQLSVSHENERKMKVWIRYVLWRHAQVLLIDLENLKLDGPPLVGRYLRKLKLGNGVFLHGSFLDFACCPVLEDLEIIHCKIRTDILSSQSVKHLIINDSRLSGEKRIHISVPNLISLLLQDNGGKSPLLEDMHSLETAIFIFGSVDYCVKGVFSEYCFYCSAGSCRHGDPERSSLILGGLSSATHLELIIYCGTLIFSRWCPTFTKLKTLLLHVPSKVADFQWMVCILEHSPVLENLTLQVPKVLGASESEGSFNAMEQLSTISEHLKAVRIKCGEVDERVYKILKLLSRFVKYIDINRPDEPLERLKFSADNLQC